MRWYEPLYMGESVAGMEKTVKYEFKYKKVPFGYYCITLPEGGDGLLDILRSEKMKLPFRRKEVLDIIGVAGSKDEACMLAGQIIWEVYKNTGGFDIKTYLGYK